VPFTSTTKLTVVSYADLGSLGARQGVPVSHTWEPPPPPPPRIVAAASTGAKLIIPLLLLLPLFLCRANRNAEAWWIWLPVVIAALAATSVVALLIDEDISLLQAVHAFLIGLAAVWLLTPYLKSRYRIVMFVKTLPVLAAFSLLAYVPTLLEAKRGWLDFRSAFAGLQAFASLAATLALVLTSLAVRRRFGRIRFLCWLAVWTVLAWTAIAAPFAVFALFGSRPELSEFIVPVLVVSGIMLLLLLPLLLLSFFQPFYRARFADWLKLPQPDTAAGMSIPPLLPGMDQAPAPTSSA
jgi:hypothetical protein